jgi:Class III cytochrome C family
MSNSKLTAIGLVLILSIVCSLAVFAEEQTEAEQAVSAGIIPVIDATTRATTRYQPFKFTSHDTHGKQIACRTCHHDMEEGETMPENCSFCHAKPDAVLKLAEAMHKICIECHTETVKKEAKSKAPVKCLGCHTERN